METRELLSLLMTRKQQQYCSEEEGDAYHGQHCNKSFFSDPSQRITRRYPSAIEKQEITEANADDAGLGSPDDDGCAEQGRRTSWSSCSSSSLPLSASRKKFNSSFLKKFQVNNKWLVVISLSVLNMVSLSDVPNCGSAAGSSTVQKRVPR